MGILFKKETKVIGIEHPFDDYYVIKMAIPKGFSWEAGQFAIVSLPGAYKGRKWRIFSIASVATDGYLMFGTRVGSESPFKQQITKLKNGDRATLRGPIGGLKFSASKNPDVLVAAGVGITPIHAYLTAHQNTSKKIHLVYASTSQYLFKSSLDQISWANPNIIIHYVKTPDEVQKTLATLKDAYHMANYYVSGSPKTIKSLKDYLKTLNINRVYSDKFMGYKS